MNTKNPYVIPDAMAYDLRNGHTLVLFVDHQRGVVSQQELDTTMAHYGDKLPKLFSIIQSSNIPNVNIAYRETEEHFSNIKNEKLYDQNKMKIIEPFDEKDADNFTMDFHYGFNPEEDLYLGKQHDDPYYQTQLEKIIAESKARTVIIIGVEDDKCALSTIIGTFEAMPRLPHLKHVGFVSDLTNNRTIGSKTEWSEEDFQEQHEHVEYVMSLYGQKMHIFTAQDVATVIHHELDLDLSTNANLQILAASKRNTQFNPLISSPKL